MVFVFFVPDSCRESPAGDKCGVAGGAPAVALPGLRVSQELQAQHSLSCISAASGKFFLNSKDAEVAWCLLIVSLEECWDVSCSS